ncbi:MAG: LexA family protein [Pygmaiobacter massiliensis]
MTTGERIKIKRKEKGLSAEYIAQKLEVSPATIYRYENGAIEKVPGEKLKDLAKVLDTTPAYLMGWETVSQPQPLDLSKIKNIEPYRPTRAIPVLGCVAAGMPLYAEENIEGYVHCDFDDNYQYFALRVSGDSMTAAGIGDGDLVIVREQPEVENGQMAVVLVNGNGATVKNYRREGNTVILSPQSFNPEHHPQFYNLKEVPVRIVGLVIESRRQFNQ